MAAKPVPSSHQARSLGPASFFILSIFIGIFAGLGAGAFRALIAFFHNLFFFGRFSISYNTNVFTAASPWGFFLILAPVVGAVVVAFLVGKFAPEAKGHGVPEVIDAIYYAKGIIRPIVALIKSVASAISIGSGGSVGREGPIIQIGSAFGSTVGQFLRIEDWQRNVLISAGAGAGIAATFNTPIGGVLFATEIIMDRVGVKTLVPVVISTAISSYIGRILFGSHPSFVVPAFEHPYFHRTAPVLLIAYVFLGLLCGGASALFIRSIYAFEDFFNHKVKGSYYRKHTLGMLIVGLIITGTFAKSGHYHVEGVGYSTVQSILIGAGYPILFLLILFALKLITTSLTLGSGASGGIFSPALFLGATLGAAYGTSLNLIFPHLGISPEAFAVVGMAGLVGGATGAAVTAIVMIFEMTRNYSVIVPMTLTVAISYGIRTLLIEENIYTLKLARRGKSTPKAFVRKCGDRD